MFPRTFDGKLMIGREVAALTNNSVTRIVSVLREHPTIDTIAGLKKALTERSIAAAKPRPQRNRRSLQWNNSGHSPLEITKQARSSRKRADSVPIQRRDSSHE